mgnify:FL=1
MRKKLKKKYYTAKETIDSRHTHFALTRFGWVWVRPRSAKEFKRKFGSISKARKIY